MPLHSHTTPTTQNLTNKFCLDLETNYTYDAFNRISDIITGNHFSMHYQWEASTGNLVSRTDNIHGLTETFQYDDADRLTDWQVNGLPGYSIEYATNGNINLKSDAGDYVYHDTKVHAVENVMNYTDAISENQQNISYTSFQKASEIQEGDHRLEFQYGPENNRKVTRLYDNDNDQLIKTRIYAGNYEKEILADGTVREYNYISGPAGLIAVYIVENGTGTLYYTVTDHLGSIVQLIDENGTVIDETNYGPWGGYRNPITWEYDNTASLSMLHRGYTGHEMMNNFDLIHMNGRMYDPALGRMLSPDNYVQDPENPQNYNRYAYCYNNPLKYTDPDGENPILIPIMIGAALGGYIGGTAAEGWEFNPGKWEWDVNTWTGIGLGVAIGATGGYGYSIGAPALAGTGFFANFNASGTISAYALTGGVAGGAIGYGSGFAGGMLYSGDNLSYSHQSGLVGLGIGSIVGTSLGLMHGGISEYIKMWDERKEEFKQYARSKAPILHDTEIEIKSKFNKVGVAQTYPLEDCKTGMSYKGFDGYYSKVHFSKAIVRRWDRNKDPLYMTNEYIWHERDHVLDNYTGYAEFIINKYGVKRGGYFLEYRTYKQGYSRGPWSNKSNLFWYMTQYYKLLYP